MAKITQKQELVRRALELYNQDYKLVNIARELNIHPSTLRRWLREVGAKPKKNPHGPNPKPEDTDPLETALNANLGEATDDAIKLAQHDARNEEDQSMMELADAQTSPAEKYQSYIAAAGVKLLRDAIKNLRGPRSVRELSELDQLIRRNLGLNAKSGGGTGKVQIDISILNNTKADRGGGAVKVSPTKIIDAEPLDDS